MSLVFCIAHGQGCLASQGGGPSEDLKRRASEAVQETSGLPPETDMVTVEFFYTGDDDDNECNMYMKASVSCDDRPNLVAGLIHALHGPRLRTVRADVTSLGGRVQHVFMLCKDANKQMLL
ncbi:Transcription factor bHLH51 [Hordeum vulgare]|nr:Transcription factor bHLH51 [Hordeum vulgare]